jgi:hypothetical protein
MNDNTAVCPTAQLEDAPYGHLYATESALGFQGADSGGDSPNFPTE